jgi:hypothetical protein
MLKTRLLFLYNIWKFTAFIGIIEGYTEVSSRIGFLAGLKAAENRLKKRGMYCV